MSDKCDGKSCFVITPIGADGSETRRKADGVICNAIKPVLYQLGFKEIIAAHEMSMQGSITKQVMSKILDCDLVVANLTGLNPNVMYELAVRHATKKPIVHICEKGTNLPFDIVDQRTIFYLDDMQGAMDLKENLHGFVEKAMEITENIDNPIYNVIRENLISNSGLPEGEKALYDFINSRFDSLDERFRHLSVSRHSKVAEEIIREIEDLPWQNKDENEIAFTRLKPEVDFDEIRSSLKSELDARLEGYGMRTEIDDATGTMVVSFSRIGNRGFLAIRKSIRNIIAEYNGAIGVSVLKGDMMI